jgi:hypothetical protein
MIKKLIVFFLSNLILASACNTPNNNDLLEEYQDFFQKGNFDSLNKEFGKWEFYSIEDKSKLEQTGYFKNGLRVGRWEYKNDKIGYIDWSSFINESQTLSTNVPTFLKMDVNEDSFIVFNNFDTLNFLKLKIAFSSYENFDILNYNKLIDNEVNNNSSKIIEKQFLQFKTTCDQVYNLNQFKGIDKSNNEYFLFTLNGVIQNILVEITVKSSNSMLPIAKEIFHSVVSNLFIKKYRFLDQNIKCEIIRNKVVKTKHSFSFGCNSSK